jgi:hypothetical protein
VPLVVRSVPTPVPAAVLHVPFHVGFEVWEVGFADWTVTALTATSGPASGFFEDGLGDSVPDYEGDRSNNGVSGVAQRKCLSALTPSFRSARLILPKPPLHFLVLRWLYRA